MRPLFAACLIGLAGCSWFSSSLPPGWHQMAFDSRGRHWCIVYDETRQGNADELPDVIMYETTAPGCAKPADLSKAVGTERK